MAKPLSLQPRVRKLLKKGIQHHQAGRRGPAEACYRRSLKVDPKCPQALHLLGLLARQADHYEVAIRMFAEALELNPDDLDTLNSLAEAYYEKGQVESAKQCYQRVTELFPESAEAHHRLGKTHERLGDWDNAMECYQRALAIAPVSPDLHASIARLQSKLGAFGDAAESCRRALALDPIRYDIHTQLGNALTDLGDFPAAVEAHRRALTLKDDSADAVFGLGYFFGRKGDIVSAIDAYRNALRLNPQLTSAQLHLGSTQLLQGNLKEAAECFERILKITPDSGEARAFLSLIHLKQGDFPLGLSLYEDRWSTPYGFRFRRKFSQPRWNGEPLEGKRILLYAEQGLGDTLQFVRYVPMVAARGGKVILEVQPRLHRLLAQTPGAAEVICRDEELSQFDWQCPLLSLPMVLGTELNSIPAEVPYIHPDPAQVESWRQRLPADSLRIGLVWGGSPLHPHELWRAIPLEQLAPLTQLEGTIFYSLQLGEPAQQIKQMGSRIRLTDLQNEQKDFADTAAIVANLDLVISIDTSVAHLAGAMGKPVWLLLSTASDWRWLLDRPDNPWYPTARLFRQSSLGDWQGVLSGVDHELRTASATAAAARAGARRE